MAKKDKTRWLIALLGIALLVSLGLHLRPWLQRYPFSPDHEEILFLDYNEVLSTRLRMDSQGACHYVGHVLERNEEGRIVKDTLIRTTFVLPEAERRKLNALLAETRFFDLADRYDTWIFPVDDGEMQILTVTTTARTKRVSAHIRIPENLRVLVRYLNHDLLAAVKDEFDANTVELAAVDLVKAAEEMMANFKKAE